MSFNQLNLKEELLRAITEMGYQEPSPIQEQAIPLLLQQKDVIGQSQTGSGKTAAFGLPILSEIEPLPNRKTQALILCPTRELCLQVADEMRKFAKYMEGIRVISVYGGQDINRQIKDIKGGSDIVVATPGRLLDHMRRRTLRFDNCHQVVLDEADEMLNMGFLEEIKDVFSFLPQQRQTVLFSATMPKPILELANEILDNPVEVKIKNKTLTVEAIQQVAYEVMPTQKNDLLVQLLELHSFDSTLIFCNTKKMVDDLTAHLNKQGYLAMALHGDIKQEMRTSIMNRFKKKQINLLIATDVAARGIDIDQLDVVINYDLPQEIEYYVHRIGRTGRAGQSGLAITFYSPRQKHLLNVIEKITRQPLTRKALPNQKELSTLTVDLIEKEVQKGLDVSHDKTSYILNQLIEKGYSKDQMLYGLLSRVVEAHTLKSIEPIKTDRKKSSGNYTTIVINLGSRHKITPAHLIAGIAESTGISGRDIGKIKISERSSTVDIPADRAKEIVEIVSKTQIGGRVPFVSIINKEKRDRPRSRRRKA
jgi:ATP-dependent RNA helicase DeaD